MSDDLSNNASPTDILQRYQRTIRRTANYFIWTAVVILVLFGIAIAYWEWQQQGSPSTAYAIGYLSGAVMGRLLRNGWLALLIILNGFLLRHYNSRISAVLFVVLSAVWLFIPIWFYLMWRIEWWLMIGSMAFYSTYLIASMRAFLAARELYKARQRVPVARAPSHISPLVSA